MSAVPPARKRLPVNPSAEQLHKQVQRLAKKHAISLELAQYQLASDYGVGSWSEILQIVESLSRGATVLSNDKASMAPLPEAANRNDMASVVRILVGEEFTQHDLDLALARAVLNFSQRHEIAQILLEQGADPDGQYGYNYGPIVFVTGECLDPEGLEFLIGAGADVTFGPIATKYGMQCPLAYFLGSYDRGHNEKKHKGIEILLRHHAYVPVEVTPEILAIHRGESRVLGDLLEQNPAMLTRRYPLMPYGNIPLGGATLLHAAVEFGELDCLDVLLNKGADMNMKADEIDGIGGQTAIFHAINTTCDRNFYTLEYLSKRVGRGIDMTVRATWQGYDKPQSVPLTPLEYAEKAEREMDPKRAHFRARHRG